MTYRTTSLPIVLAILLAPALSNAQEDPRKAQAEAVFAEGIKLHDAGKNAEALAKYQKAYEVYPTTNILFATARIEQLLGHSLEAIRHYREALKSPLLHPKNRELGKTYVVELEGLLGRIDVKAPAGAAFVIDGKRYMAPLDEPVDVEPGPVEIDAAVGGAKYVGKATVERGTRRELELRPVESHVTEPPPATERSSFWTTRHAIGATLGGLAVVAAGVGTVFLVVRNGHVSDAKDIVAANARPCAVPTAASCRAYDDARDGFGSAGTGAGVSFVASAALLGVGAAFLFWPDSKKETSFRLVPSGPGLSAVGTF